MLELSQTEGRRLDFLKLICRDLAFTNVERRVKRAAVKCLLTLEHVAVNQHQSAGLNDDDFELMSAGLKSHMLHVLKCNLEFWQKISSQEP